MAIYCWGNTTHGELGLGGIEDEQILTPRKMAWSPPNSCVVQVSCGRWHTLFLTSSGKVYSCGSNDNGQLGHELPTKRPRMSLPIFKLIEELDNYIITNVSCGARHSLALSEWGQIFSWGHNDYGQLGLANGQDLVAQPKIVRNLVSKTVLQIACGNNHSLALTSCGELYSWGSNIYGQLGVGSPGDVVHSNVPRLITALNGIPIAFIACGGNHAFVISKSGAVFGWGRNDCGQLGLNDCANRCYPTQLKTLRSLCVRYITCGDEFSVFLTNDGGVFTCGSGRYGQLGHGSNGNEVLPRMVVELMGSTVTQIACGTRHTLALVPSRGRVYGFGLGCSGQLGIRVNNNSPVPQVVLGPWVSPSGQALIQSEMSDNNENTCYIIKQIFSGGDHSLVTCTSYEDKIPAVDCRTYDEKTQVLSLNVETTKRCAEIAREGAIDMDLLALVELIFKSQACLNGSFLLDDNQHFCCTSKHHGVDLKAAQNAFHYLRKVENDTLKTLIWEAITNELLKTLVTSPADVETLRIFLILPLYHEFVNSKNYDKLHTPFSQAVIKLKDIPRKIVAKWWSQTSTEWFEHIVAYYKDVVAYIISFKIPHNISSESEKRLVTYNSNLIAALNLIVFLHGINHKERKDKIHYESFHWSELADYVDVQQNYIYWLFDKTPDAFNICNYPMIFNAAAKTTLLQTDQAIQMHNAMNTITSNSILSYLTTGQPIQQFIVLNVSRENLVQDTLREIGKCSQGDLKKPLKVKFCGEEAEDAGGVRKEFFMLLLKDLIDPKYGMFKEYEDSRVVWFADMTFETEEMYILIGIICGLAIYNFTIINLPFPLALYKKIMDEKVDLCDLRELSPTLANSMQQILDYDGDDFEETFDLHFEISRDIFGESTSEPLKPNGANISVTKENRQEFVDLYVDFIFNKTVDDKFKAFQKGFMKVCWGRVLKIFRPEELMAMVVGNEEYDWKAWELNCDYKNGYTVSDDTVKWFWETFHEMSLEDKKKFLLFLTGSDRIPIQGMKAIKMIIQPTNDDKCLPVAHTCFNLLDLPRYKTKERLKYKLMQAIQQTQGFSLV
ncbi:probable E3 ubiquitin-protein ligase HERC4 isoform X1 [Stomoxys calcitrans]|uniref:probable E3 ubiquitin-protein ligase HERC4 isoform X1 n=1 Tax=Stomoxys calcitrans TaxID=35570 RepID=UPI0027E30716|nr:probable E3 ubiquitin-protein ligase HERC4 isoform X1 [Stomoxys calcitrans]